MYNDIVNRIRISYNTFTSVERRIADTILETPARMLVNMTISHLAQMCSTSETSIFRFCKKIGLSGYHELKWQMFLGEPTQTVLEASTCEVSLQMLNAISEETVRISNIYKQCIENMVAMINTQNVSDAVDLLVNARNIYFFGAGISMLSAMEAKNQFLNVTPNVNASTNLYMQQAEAERMTSDDVAVFFSFSGATAVIMRIAETLTARDVPIILITRYAKSPLSKLSRYCFISDTNDVGTLHATMVAPTSQLFMMDILYTIYCTRTQENAKSYHASISKLVMDHLV